jgi:histidinol-phosphate phosphatase family protein
MDGFKIEAIFIDRDGTIGGTDEVVLPGDFELFPKTKESIEKMKKLGIKLFGFTNQPGISRGEATIEAFINEMKDFGFDNVYICPHQHTDRCECRKPNPGMLLRAADENQLNLSNCIVIGDRWSDILAASNAGCKKILVLTGAGNDAINKYRYKWANIEAEFIASDFEEAVSYIVKLVSDFGEDRAIR